MPRPTRLPWMKGARWVLFASLLTGCQFNRHQETSPLADPQAAVSQRQFAGTPLSGELAQSIDAATAAQAWKVEARVVAVKILPTEGFEGIGPHARLVLVDGEGDLMAPSTRLVYSTVFRSLDEDAKLDPLLGDPNTWLDLMKTAGAVAPGTTISFEIAQPPAAINQAERQQVSVELSRTVGDDGYQLALVSNNQVTPPAPRPEPKHGKPEQPPPATQPAKQVRETILVSRATPSGKDRIALALPMDFTAAGARGLVIDLTIDLKPAGSVASDLKTAIDSSAALAASRLKQPVVSSDDLLMAAAIDSFVAAGDAPRATLVYLAQQSGAKLTENVALVAEDKVLSLIAKAIRDKIPQLPSHDHATIAWLLDRMTIQTLASIKDDETARSLSAVQGVLITYAGEAGRQLDLLQSLANESVSSVDLDHRLIAEHLTYLEDNSPAARVRAYDWLRARSAAPPGYDPLAKPKARRAALEQFNDAATTNPTTQP